MKCPSCGENEQIEVKGRGDASCVACGAAFAPLSHAFATLKRAAVEGKRLQEILAHESTKHTPCMSCGDMFTTFPLLGETLHACVPCQAVWLRNGALEHFASLAAAATAPHGFDATAAQMDGASAPPPAPPPLGPPPSAAVPSMGSPWAIPPKAPAPTESPFAALSARLLSNAMEARTPPSAPSTRSEGEAKVVIESLDPPMPAADTPSLDPPLPPSSTASPFEPITPMPAAPMPTAPMPATRAMKPRSPTSASSSGGGLDPEARAPRPARAAARRKPKIAGVAYVPESGSSPLRVVAVLVLIAGAAFAAWRLVAPAASTALGGGKGVSFGKGARFNIEPVALGTRAATKFTSAQSGGELIAWYVPGAGSEHPGSGDLLLVEILGKEVKLVGVPRRVGELTVMNADVRLVGKSGRARAFFTGKDAWILIAVSTADGFERSREADRFLSSLGDLR